MVCVVLLYLCTYKIIYIHQTHIRVLLFFLCHFSTCHFFYFVKNTYLLSMIRVRGGAFLPLGEGVKYLPNPHILHFSVK